MLNKKEKLRKKKEREKLGKFNSRPEIKTPQEFGAVLLGYETKFKKPLYQVINGKVKDWKSIKNSLGKIKGSLNIDFCETYSNPNTQET